MHGLKTVAGFTIKEMIKRKSFIISNLIIIALIVVGFNIPNILNKINGEEVESEKKLLIVDKENIFEGNLNSLNNMEIGYKVEISNEDVSFEKIKERMENEEIDEALVINKMAGILDMEYIVKNLLYMDKIPESLVSSLSSIYTNMQVSKLNLSMEEVANITPNFDFRLTQTEEKEVEGNPVVMMLLSLVLFFAIYFCAYQVSNSITTEKTSKIIETLVTSTKPSTIVLGKTIGVRNCSD
ncbi:MAG: ABC transporter permease [Clostridia bacterium]|jgi:ABC-2 type transport system permease protein|nr:ABC transporter permease [Clostridia bacterium]